MLQVTWDEWVAELFHDEPQEPVFRDGISISTPYAIPYS
jgi:hypothetical protein